MAKTKEINRRIKSITSTKKITRAMEMVAAAKMRKAIDAVLKTRTYANLSWETVLHLSRSSKNNGEYIHPLLTKRSEIKKVAIILITSNRGMCGGYNMAILSKVRESIRKHENVPVEFILLGKKGASVYSQNQIVAAEFPKSDLVSNTNEVVPVVNMAIKDFLSGKYDKVFVAYTDFVSVVKQIPRIKQLLPIDIDSSDEYLGIVADPRVSVNVDLIAEKEKKHLMPEMGYEYVFEPSPEQVLNNMIPRLLEVQVFQALLEANASEHSARMNAMHQATEAANDMVNELKLFYNKARQASITAEIAEISAGANALLD
ncbi:MAG: ATP synthase F1 subunit gamma [Patescibacteria group bacterium]|jgi:F-type H+-transporting ATPase subunit gamma|nr:ATP synthase F1 subunit gamma [bacterium]HQC49785.1 ATP synthase F1 subunit gamma [bacterium]